MNIIDQAYAMGTPSGGGASQGGPAALLSFLPFVLIIGIFYFLIMRPQQKKQKEQQRMIDALRKGDKVLTSGGFYGTISGIKEKEGTLVLKVARISKEDVEIEVTRSSVSRVISKE